VVINAAVYPYLANRYAQFGRQRAFVIASAVSGGLLAVGLVLAVPALSVAQAGIAAYFPQYEMATTILPVFTVIAILRISDFFSSYLVIVNLERWVLLSDLGCAILGIAVWLLVRQPWQAGQTLGLGSFAELAALLAGLSYASKLVISVMTAGKGRS
jgi:hypothetical protein